MDKAPFNVVLAEARNNLGLSIQEAAERTGFTPGFIRSYEDCAKNPTAKTMYRFAVAYGMRFEILPSGITIRDAEDEVLLRHWKPEEEE